MGSDTQLSSYSEFFKSRISLFSLTDFEFLFSCFSLTSAKTEMPLNRYMETISAYNYLL